MYDKRKSSPKIKGEVNCTKCTLWVQFMALVLLVVLLVLLDRMDALGHMVLTLLKVLASLTYKDRLSSLWQLIEKKIT